MAIVCAMDFPQQLSDLGDEYADKFSKLSEGQTALLGIGAVCEHLSDMAAALSNNASALLAQLGPDVLVAVQSRSPDSQALQDAEMHIGHVKHVLNAVESLATRAAQLLVEANGG